MKKLALALAVFQTLAWAAAAPSNPQKINGWLDDQKCAGHRDTPNASCARKCAEAGIPVVFVADGDKKIYKADKQDLLKPLVGQHVTITGTIDGDSLQIDKVDPIKESKAAE